MSKPLLVVCHPVGVPGTDAEFVTWECTGCGFPNITGHPPGIPIGEVTNQCERCGTWHEVRLPCFKYVECPACGRAFRLNWNDYSNLEGEVQTLILRGCPSGGIYDVSIQCPHCQYKEDL